MKIQSRSAVHRSGINIAIAKAGCHLLGSGAFPACGVSVDRYNNLFHNPYLRFALPCFGEVGCHD
jgi:hypothetical protein